MGWVPSLVLAATGCCGLSPLLSSAPVKITGPSCDPVSLPSESPTEQCSTTRCALYPSSKDSVFATRMETAVCAACCTLCKGQFTSPGHGLEGKVFWRGKDLRERLEPSSRWSLEQKETPSGFIGLAVSRVTVCCFVLLGSSGKGG